MSTVGITNRKMTIEVESFASKTFTVVFYIEPNGTTQSLDKQLFLEAMSSDLIQYIGDNFKAWFSFSKHPEAHLQTHYDGHYFSGFLTVALKEIRLLSTFAQDMELFQEKIKNEATRGTPFLKFLKIKTGHIFDDYMIEQEYDVYEVIVKNGCIE
jgi:hypothetical protein